MECHAWICVSLELSNWQLRPVIPASCVSGRIETCAASVPNCLGTQQSAEIFAASYCRQPVSVFLVNGAQVRRTGVHSPLDAHDGGSSAFVRLAKPGIVVLGAWGCPMRVPAGFAPRKGHGEISGAGAPNGAVWCWMRSGASAYIKYGSDTTRVSMGRACWRGGAASPKSYVLGKKTLPVD